jgi:hypothetical protein
MKASFPSWRKNGNDCPSFTAICFTFFLMDITGVLKESMAKWAPFNS